MSGVSVVRGSAQKFQFLKLPLSFAHANDTSLQEGGFLQCLKAIPLSADRRTSMSGVSVVRRSAPDISFAKLFFLQRKAGLQAQALTTTGTTTSENLSTVGGRHSLTETVYLAALTLLRLECS